MKRLLFTLILISIFSCQETFDPSKFDGTWLNTDEEGIASHHPLIIFKNDSILFEDIYGYGIKGRYKISNNKISYFLKNDTLQYKLSFNYKDSTLKIGNYKFNFWEKYYDGSDYIPYELKGLKSNAKFSSDSLLKFQAEGLHLIKKDSDSVKVKLNDKLTADLFEIKLFLSYPTDYKTYPNSVIYIEKSVTLKDLISCYKQMWIMNRRKVLLITDYNFKTNLYSGLFDIIDFWDIQFKGKFPPTPISDFDSRNKYLKKNNPEIITINSEEDFKLISENSKKNLLVSINPNLDFESYINLKKLLVKQKKENKTKIRTEFILAS